MAQLVKLLCLSCWLFCSFAARLTLDLDGEGNLGYMNSSSVPPSRHQRASYLSDILQQQKTLRTAAGARRPCEQQTEQEYCFGYVGPGCDKTPGDTCAEGFQAVSVGSLAHDACCYECTDGLACSGSAPALMSRESLDDSYPCSPEWRKAVWNQIERRFWCKKQYAEPSQVNVIPAKNFSLEMGLRQYGVTKYEGILLGYRVLTPYKAIEDLCAPAGTRLDCMDCRACDGNCEANIGDSNFCCSRRFSKVRVSFWRKIAKGVIESGIQPADGECAALDADVRS